MATDPRWINKCKGNHLRTYEIYIAFIIVFAVDGVLSQTIQSDDWFNFFWNSGEACLNTTCRTGDKTCECFLTIEHTLTMMYKKPGSVATLLKPKNGHAVKFGTEQIYDTAVEDTFTLADGEASRLVISINGRFPGPTITAYEYQEVIVHVRNLMKTESTSVHWHGIHQKGTTWSDGVAFISQCPILPGQTFTYRFKAKPFGTSFYHAHIGDQRTMGLYGPLIILPQPRQQISQPQEGDKVFVVIIQDWNHDEDYNALYKKMLWGVYDKNTGEIISETSDPSGAKYSRFHCQSALINGRGRYYRTSLIHNESPITKFVVERNTKYRFRVINAASLYPFRVFVQNHRLISIVASDGFEIAEQATESFIIHPGERIDFTLLTDENPNTYLLVAETLEVETEYVNEYHAAEAIIHYKESSNQMNINPPKVVKTKCQNTCRVFNCPFAKYADTENLKCVTFNDVSSNDPNSNTKEIEANEVVEMFFNFAFPAENGYGPGSVNGHEFRQPTVAAYAQPDKVNYNCEKCNASVICKCTYSVTIDPENKGQVYQFVITNIGKGSGWSHPVHLHGHSFYVMRTEFGTYDQNGRIIANRGQDTIDILCEDETNYCSDAKWRNASWSNGKHPNLNWNNPPQKDTIIIPTGGYVVIRFKADNPGVWFFHCHIDFHNTNGMGMIINESPKYQPQVPKNFPMCESFDTILGPISRSNAAKPSEHVMHAMTLLIAMVNVNTVTPRDH